MMAPSQELPELVLLIEPNIPSVLCDSDSMQLGHASGNIPLPTQVLISHLPKLQPQHAPILVPGEPAAYSYRHTEISRSRYTIPFLCVL